MSNIRLLPYKLGTQAGHDLIRSLDGLMIHPTRGTYRRKDAHRIINWGNSNRAFDELFRGRDFNHPAAVALAIDKLSSFEVWSAKGLNHPEWSHDPNIGLGWLHNDSIVIGRSTARGSGGAGITVYRSGDTLDQCLFYSRVSRCSREYRIHVGRTIPMGVVANSGYPGIIDVVQKKRRNDVECDPLIRSHQNGWVFCRNDIVPPNWETLDHAYRAVDALGLDFGAVDIGVAKDGTPTIFEVNTAPGIEGTTLTKYRDYFNLAIQG